MTDYKVEMSMCKSSTHNKTCVIILAASLLFMILYFYNFSKSFVQKNFVQFIMQNQNVSNSTYERKGMHNSDKERIFCGNIISHIDKAQMVENKYITLTSYQVSKYFPVSSGEPNLASADSESEWIETLNYTIDYGDTTCIENKKGNPWKDVFVDILKHWKLISKKYSISYFLAYGSLIGALRNGNFIPYDGDMDIMVDESFYEVIASIDNKRNFTARADDVNFHLVVQNFFREQYTNMNKPRQNCLGKVNTHFKAINYSINFDYNDLYGS